MQPTSGTTTSVWMATTDVPSEKTLDKDISTNVCIIGAGIAGLTTAYLLAREGKGVVVLDDGPIGGGMTARTTAHLTNALDDRFYELERLFGEEGARLAGESHTAAIDRVEAIVGEEKLDCEFERLDGYLFLPTNGKLQVLEDELPAAQENINVAAQYTDIITPGEVNSVDEIPKGEGAVMRSGLSKLAIYRDDDGAIHSMSAACVHLGCIVMWNAAEKTWDCPCQDLVTTGPAGLSTDQLIVICRLKNSLDRVTHAFRCVYGKVTRLKLTARPQVLECEQRV